MRSAVLLFDHERMRGRTSGRSGPSVSCGTCSMSMFTAPHHNKVLNNDLDDMADPSWTVDTVR